MLKKARELAESLKRELIVYRRVLADPRTPVSAKIFLGLAIGYLCMPFDLIPDFIPVLGHLDDAVIVPSRISLCGPAIDSAGTGSRASGKCFSGSPAQLHI
jgi:uncharacterized membrane protein YkvA (DUF1232 family)